MTPEERAELAEDVALRVVELLRADVLSIGNKPLTVAQVADMLGRSPDWVRDNRHRLGVLPSEGKRPRLMFDAARVRDAMRAPVPPTIVGTARNPRARRRPRRPDLLPIRGAA